MNEDDQAYYASLELEKRITEERRLLADLSARGAREQIKGDAGSVAVNPAGVVLDIQLDRRNIEFLAESALAEYIVEAINRARKVARLRQRALLAENTER